MFIYKSPIIVLIKFNLPARLSIIPETQIISSTSIDMQPVKTTQGI